MNQLSETKMRYQSFESITGKTSSERRFNFFKLLVGIAFGHWIGRSYCQGPRCFETLASGDISGDTSNGILENGDQNHASDGNSQVYDSFYAGANLVQIT